MEPPSQKSCINEGSAQQGVCGWVSAVPAASAGDDGAERGKRFVQSDLRIFGFWRSRAHATALFGALALGLLMQEGCRVARPFQGFVPLANLCPPLSFPAMRSAHRSGNSGSFGMLQRRRACKQQCLHAA